MDWGGASGFDVSSSTITQGLVLLISEYAFAHHHARSSVEREPGGVRHPSACRWAGDLPYAGYASVDCCAVVPGAAFCFLRLPIFF